MVCSLIIHFKTELKQAQICKKCCTKYCALVWMSFLYHIIGKEESKDINITVCNDASHKNLWPTVDELKKGAGQKCSGRASHDQWECVFYTKFGHVTWIHSEVMCLFVTGHSHCSAPLCPTSTNTNTHLHTHKHKWSQKSKLWFSMSSFLLMSIFILIFPAHLYI